MLLKMTRAIYNFITTGQQTCVNLLEVFAVIYKFKQYTAVTDTFVEQMDNFKKMKYINANDMLRVIVETMGKEFYNENQAERYRSGRCNDFAHILGHLHRQIHLSIFL